MREKKRKRKEEEKPERERERERENIFLMEEEREIYHHCRVLILRFEEVKFSNIAI